jgi:hypothetical protein
MTRKRGFHLAALVVLAVTVLLVSVVLSAPGPESGCPPRPLSEVCDPAGDAVSTSRMWVGVLGGALAFLLFLAGTLEGAFPEGETQTGE